MLVLTCIAGGNTCFALCYYLSSRKLYLLHGMVLLQPLELCCRFDLLTADVSTLLYISVWWNLSKTATCGPVVAALQRQAAMLVLFGAREAG